MPLIVSVNTTAECLRTDCNSWVDTIKKIIVYVMWRVIREFGQKYIHSFIDQEDSEPWLIIKNLVLMWL